MTEDAESPASGAADGARDQASARPDACGLTMPTDFSVALVAKGGERMLAADQGDRTQPMRGFEDTYVDIVDYIVRVTHRIWEEKDIGYIYETYRHNCRVTDDLGLQCGNDKIVADTVHTINAFPDIRLYADEVIWAGDDDQGFHTSHRTVITGHNTGYSRWGPPTGRRVTVRCIANCVALGNEIFEEWVIYDTAAMLAQLGFDVRALARVTANAADSSKLTGPRAGEIERLAGQKPPPHLPGAGAGRFDVDEFVRRAYHYTWNWRNLSTIDRAYVETIRYHGSTGRELYGGGQLKTFVLSMLAMFPDLAMHVDDVYWMGNDADGYLVSVRWSALGTHRGHGIYGPPTGRQVGLWGLSQHRIVAGRIVEEWTVFNEFGVLGQLLRDEPTTVNGRG